MKKRPLYFKRWTHRLLDVWSTLPVVAASSTFMYNSSNYICPANNIKPALVYIVGLYFLMCCLLQDHISAGYNTTRSDPYEFDCESLLGQESLSCPIWRTASTHHIMCMHACVHHESWLCQHQVLVTGSVVCDNGGARIINLGIPTTKTNKTGRKVQFIFKIIITVQ
jgi:hypothetical protein